MAQPAMPKTQHWRLAVDFEGLGWLTIDTPGSPVNVLSRDAITELEKIVGRLEDLIAAEEIKGVILLSGKSNGF
ncbi:MAG TPA: 3-hydroxyacyl-CoA dehydrogenase, partial [Devosiaceae bacterium]|nr:3-hydroxyacyl-CoA dehydrogenase [Devosiaceae bacterium]